MRVRVIFACCCLLCCVAAPPSRAAEPPITAAALSPDGRNVVVGSQAGISVFSWPKLQPVRRMPARLPHIHDLAFSPDGKKLAAAGGAAGESGGFELLAWPEGTPLARMTSLADAAHAIVWLDAGERLALACHDGKIVLSDQAGEKLQPLAGHSRPVLGLAELPDGKLVSGGSDQSVRVWDPATGRLQRTLANHTSDVRDLAVRPAHDGPPMIASAGADKTVRFWQPTIGRLVRFARLKSAPLSIDFTRDGDLLLAACEDGRLRAIDPATAEVVLDAPAIDGWATVVLADADRRALVGGERGQLKVVQVVPAAPADTQR